MLGLALIVLVVGMALAAPLAPYSPKYRDATAGMAGPSAEHWLGTELKTLVPAEGGVWTFVQGLLEHWKILLGLVLLGIVLFARGGIVGMLAGGTRRHG